MFCDLFKKTTLLLIAIFLTFGITISFQNLFAAWSAPTVPPPSGTIASPVFSASAINQNINQVSGAGGGLTVAGGIITPLGVTATGKVTAAAFEYDSDITLKENIQPINNALDKVLQLNGVSFNWKESGEASLGVIAQEVEGVFPELVHTNKATGLKSVEYGNLVAPLIEAIKEQQKQIEELKKQVEELNK